ncbi:hypothetical protein [Terriglobus albidus]|uniref:hypothetical protein n=1 Tax=Terriglobus albidus TaxID=1592106 RepID=UPI0021E0F9D6|nr:hypothetical protein [Terriglobus albidus]
MESQPARLHPYVLISEARRITLAASKIGIALYFLAPIMGLAETSNHTSKGNVFIMVTTRFTDETDDNDRKAFERWQEFALTQLGYTINLILTFAGATLAFAVKTMMGSTFVLRHWGHYLFHSSLLLLGFSIMTGIAANITRCVDFSTTRRAALARCNGNKENHHAMAQKADTFGRWTWRFFACQSAAFCGGVFCLSFAIWLGYHCKI